MRNVALLVVAAALLWLYAQSSSEPGSVSPESPEAASAAPLLDGFQCRIPYRLRAGEIDAAFGMSRRDLEAALREAFAVWEGYARSTLFVITDDASATPVHLRFDERQVRSDEMAEERRAQQDIAIEIDRRRAELEDLRRDLEHRQAEFRDEADRHASAVRTYEEWVAAFNRSSSGNHAERRRLAAERESLERQSAHLEALQQRQLSAQEHFNGRVEAFNRAVARLNERSQAAAAAAAGHGPVGAGRYARTAAGESIEVYLVTSHADLLLTLAHELGHALGIGHVDDSDALMSAVKVGPSSGRGAAPVLRRADRAALERVCAGKL